MERFQWREAFSVGDGLIDEQHKQLFALLARLHRDIHTRQALAVVREALQELLEYTQHHFAEEEALMETVGYPGLNQHKQLHDQLLRRTHEMSERCALGEEDMSIELLEFLNAWLIQHILEQDRAIGNYLRQR